MLQEPHPGDLLEFASSVLAAVDPRGHSPLAQVDDQASEPLALAELASTFIAVPCRETTALLTVLAEMADDELVMQRLRRELTDATTACRTGWSAWRRSRSSVRW